MKWKSIRFFSDWYKYLFTRRDGSAWLERKVVSHVAANLYRRRNFFFFSTVVIPDDKLIFLGLFGNWFRIPKIDRIMEHYKKE